jgi:hypothetical protein
LEESDGLNSPSGENAQVEVGNCAAIQRHLVRGMEARMRGVFRDLARIVAAFRSLDKTLLPSDFALCAQIRKTDDVR